MHTGRNDFQIMFISGEEDINGTDMIRRYQGNRRISELLQLMARRKMMRIRIGGDLYEVKARRITEEPEYEY